MRVEESSKNPDYLAIKFLYEGGQTEIVGVDVAKVCPQGQIATQTPFSLIYNINIDS